MADPTVPYRELSSCIMAGFSAGRVFKGIECLPAEWRTKNTPFCSDRAPPVPLSHADQTGQPGLTRCSRKNADISLPMRPTRHAIMK